MNFLSLPFLFPILMFLALAGWPLIVAGIEACLALHLIATVPSKGRYGLSLRDRMSMAWGNFKFHTKRGAVRYFKAIGRLVIQVGCLIVMSCIFILFVVPFGLLGMVLGAASPFMEMAKESLLGMRRVFADATEGGITALCNASVRD